MNVLEEKKLLKAEKPRRFPGTTSFEDSELSAALFFGREEETAKLLHLILGEPLSIIFSKSGNGKTSLLQAGIFRKLRERNFYPLLVRFNKKGFSPEELIKAELASINSVPGFEVLGLEENVDLSFFLSKLEIWSPDDKLKTPVLVFDQFEEIFTLAHNEPFRAKFFTDLANILKAKKEAELDIKIVIGIREDFLGHLEKLSEDIPSVFVNRFRLEALKKGSAEAAIVEPSKKLIPGIEFESEPFYFSENAKNELIEFLSLRMCDNNVWQQTNEIEPLQLQIICSELEQRIIDRKIENINNRITIQEHHLGGHNGLQNILGGFYDKQLKKVFDDYKLTSAEQRAIREIIEVALIANGRRIPMHYNAILRTVRKDAIDQLIKNKLLKIDTHQDNVLVELSHDNLVTPILKSYNERKELEDKQELKALRKKRLTRRYIATAILLGVLGITITMWIMRSYSLDLRMDRYKIAAKYEKNVNTTLAYKLISYAYKEDPANKDIAEEYQSFDKKHYSYIIKRFKIENPIKYVCFLKDKKEYCVIDKNTFYRWKDNGILDTSFTMSGNIIGYGTLGNHCHFIVQQYASDSTANIPLMTEIRDEDNKSIFSCKVPCFADKAVISPDGNFFAIDSLVYKVGVQNPIYNIASKLDDADYRYYFKSVQSMVNTRSELGKLLIKRISKDQEDKLREDDYKAVKVFSRDGKYLMSFKSSSVDIIDLKTGKIKTISKDLVNYDQQVLSSSVVANIQGYPEFLLSPSDVDTVKKGKIGSSKPFNKVSNFLNNFSSGNNVRNVLTSAISGNNNYVLTGLEDNSAVLWGLSGEKVSILKGHNNKITFVGFVDNSHYITGDAKGLIMIWKKGNAADTENGNELISFSPYEYQILGLDESKFRFDELYNPHTFDERLTALYDYSNSIPDEDGSSDDKGYRILLSKSISEVNEQYQSCEKNERFRSINKPNQKLFFIRACLKMNE